MHASVLEDFTEHSAGPTKVLYATPNNAVTEKIVDVNLGICTFMRAPGEAPGTAVLEIAMDELAEKLKIDPLQLRLINYAELDPSHDRPYTSKNLREAYRQAADRFGWSKRNATPGHMTEGNELIGYGMATATYPANRSSAQAIVRISAGGKVMAGSGTQDLGTGMYTMIAQTAANALNMDPSLIEVKLGDSTLPKAPVSGGSQSTASVTPAVYEAAQQAKLKLAELAVNDSASPLHGMKTTDLDTKDGKIFAKSAPAASESIATLMARNGNKTIEATGSAEPSEGAGAFTSASFGAVFVEVAVDKSTHMVKVRRVVGTYDIGTLMNKTTGINQLVGGIVWGVSFALARGGAYRPRLRSHRQRKLRRVSRPRQPRHRRHRRDLPRHPRHQVQPARRTRHRRDRHHWHRRRHSQRHLQRHRQTHSPLPHHARKNHARLILIARHSERSEEPRISRFLPGHIP